MSSNPICVTMKIPLVRMATRNYRIQSTSLEKAQIPVSSFCCARNRVCYTVFQTAVKNLQAIFLQICDEFYLSFLVAVFPMDEKFDPGNNQTGVPDSAPYDPSIMA